MYMLGVIMKIQGPSDTLTISWGRYLWLFQLITRWSNFDESIAVQFERGTIILWWRIYVISGIFAFRNVHLASISVRFNMHVTIRRSNWGEGSKAAVTSMFTLGTADQGVTPLKKTCHLLRTEEKTHRPLRPQCVHLFMTGDPFYR